MTPAPATPDRRRFLKSLAATAPAWLFASPLLSTAVAEDRVASAIQAAPQKHALMPAVRMAAAAKARADALAGYTATFTKRELVGGSLVEARMDLKLRHAPKSVYLLFHGDNEGRELIWVDGKNGGNMLVHETGLAALVGTISVDPAGSLAMKESRRPVTMIGMSTMAGKLIDQWILETRLPEPAIKFYPNAKLSGVACKVIEVTHARPHKTLKAQRTRVYIEASTGLPVRVQNYDFNPRGGEPVLIEDYAYTGVKANPGLTDLDFDVNNPAYDY